MLTHRSKRELAKDFFSEWCRRTQTWLEVSVALIMKLVVLFTFFLLAFALLQAVSPLHLALDLLLIFYTVMELLAKFTGLLLMLSLGLGFLGACHSFLTVRRRGQEEARQETSEERRLRLHQEVREERLRERVARQRTRWEAVAATEEQPQWESYSAGKQVTGEGEWELYPEHSC